MNKLTTLTRNTRYVFFLWLIVSAAALIHRLILGPGHYQNFLIFREATFNLFAGNDLYGHVSSHGLQIDLYKYSPAFAFLFAPFAFVPVWAGYMGWNLLNAFALFFAVKNCKALKGKEGIALVLLLIDSLTSLQNSQSNGLMAALMISAYNAFESDQDHLAAWLLTLSVFIKLFSLPFFALFLLYRNKLKFIVHAAIAMVAFSLLPAAATGFPQLVSLYESWLHLLKEDQVISRGISFMGLVHAFTGMELNRSLTQLFSGIVMLLPLLLFRKYSDPYFRLLLVSSMLLWCILFNHRAESNTFVIAMAGILLWFFAEPRKKWETGLLVLSVLLITFSPTDLFPAVIRKSVIVPYSLKALPVLLIWICMQNELWKSPNKAGNHSL